MSTTNEALGVEREEEKNSSSMLDFYQCTQHKSSFNTQAGNWSNAKEKVKDENTAIS